LPEWFDGFFNWRFPILGEVAVRGMRLQLQTALEPWPVLAEDMGNRGTARYVDSSTERVQVKLLGALSNRYALFCNDHQVPLVDDPENNAKIGAVRFTSKLFAHRIHPGLKMDSPLIFDIVDTWHDKSIGGCRYAAMPANEEIWQHLPINAREAESRRQARFLSYGHTPGDFKGREPIKNPDYPNLLDLRRC